MRKLSWIALLVVAAAGSARAQGASIDAGMSREQVIARLGKPVSEHSSGPRTYLYYSNGDEKKALPPVKKEAPPARKAAPPAARTHEPLKGTDTKKIAAPARATDSAKRATPAPTKKP